MLVARNMARKLVCRPYAPMSGLTVVIPNCVALCSGMCAHHIPWRAFEALTKAQEKVKFMLEVIGPNALQRVATPMLLSCPPSPHASRPPVSNTPQHTTRTCL